MKKRFNFATVLALMLLVSVGTYLMTRRAAQQSMNDKLDYVSRIEESTMKYREARDLILGRYIGESDEAALEEGAVRGMIAALNDRWSSYLTKEQYERNSRDGYVGIGITLQPETDNKAPLTITEVYTSSPAAEAGVQTGDQITAVDGVQIADIGREEAINRIQGEEYTSVTITILRDGTSQDHSIIRRQVTRNMVKNEIIGDIGYIRVEGFDTRVNADFEEAVKRLSDTRGLIIDVRENPGGSVDVMSAMLDLLLPEGRLITLEQKDGAQEHKTSEASCIDVPIVVLIDEESYSAAEFFAACLSEYDWAKTVGEATTGKGYAQVDVKMTDGSALHLSVLRYYTPNGVSLAGVGIQPDYPVEMSAEERGPILSDHTADKQFQKAVEVLKQLIEERKAQTDAEGAAAGQG